MTDNRNTYQPQATPDPGDKRIEGAQRHIEGWHIAREITDTKDHPIRINNELFHSFLAGWDAAMELKDSELAAENSALQNRLLDIVEFGCIDWIPDDEPYDQVGRFDPCELGM